MSIVCPGGMNTTTKLCIQNRKLNWISRTSVMDPECVAKTTMNHFLNKKELIIPGFMNRVFMFLDAILPSVLKNRLTNNVIKEV